MSTGRSSSVYFARGRQNMLATPFKRYWLQGALMLTNPAIRVNARFAELGNIVLLWA